MPARQRRLEHLRASTRATTVGQRDVQDEEDRPDGLRHFETPPAASFGRREIGLHVQRGDDPEDDGRDAADEDGEEIVDARAPAPQTIEALKMKTRAAPRPAMNGRMLTYCWNGGSPRVIGMRPA